MIRTRKVGTLTAGITLVAFGVLFLLRFILPQIDYTLLISCWPAVLILLGLEIIGSYFFNKEEKLQYDGGAIALIILLTFFAMGMASFEFFLKWQMQHWMY